MSDELKLKIMQELSKGNVRIGQFIMFLFREASAVTRW